MLRIIGAGGHGKVVADIADAIGIKEIDFLDSRYPDLQSIGQYSVVGKTDTPTQRPLFCAIGANATRSEVFESLDLSHSPTLLHPSSIISQSVRLGAGTVAMAAAVVNADTLIGRGVILNTACSVDHDCVVEDFVHISPGAHLAGGVTVGKHSWIGIGAVVREGVSIGCGVMVGAGAAVVSDIPDNVCVGGIPAKEI